MSILLNQAKKIAQDNEIKNNNEAKFQADMMSSLNSELDKMKSLVLKELSKLDGQKNKYGQFRLELVKDGAYDVIAYLWNDPKLEKTLSQKVAWVKAKIVTTTCRLSDDSPLETFTDGCIWTRLYRPQYSSDHNGTWDLAEDRWYHNGGWTESCSSVKEVPKFFEKIADYLANWF